MIADLKPYPKYKESGLLWLGRVPGHWEVRRMKSAVMNVIEQTFEMRSEDVYVALEHVESWSGKARPQSDSSLFTGQVKRFRKGDVLFGKLRPYLAKVTRISKDGVCAGEFFVLRPTDQAVSSAYLEHQLRAKHTIDVINGSTFGAKMPRADWQFCGNLPLPLPPPEEQAAIERFLGWASGQLERAILAKRKVITLLNEQKQAIIHRAVTRGLSPSVPLKPSGTPWLGDVPQHWEVRRIASFSYKVTNGWVGPTRDILTDAGVPYLQSLHIKGGEIRFNKQYFVREQWLRKRDKIRLRAGDVVVVQTGDVGQVANIPPEFDGAGCHALIIIGTRRSVVSGSYLSRVLNCWYGKVALKLIETGALLPHLNCGYVRDVQVPVPPLREQAEIESQLDLELGPISVAISRLEREIELIREYRTRLVADVVTGKLDVREVVARLPEEAPLDSAVVDASLGEETDIVDEEAAV